MKALPLLAALVITGCAGQGGPTIVTQTQAADTVTVTKQPPKPAGPLATDGTYLIGPDVKPGTYRTAGPADPRNECYWQRMNATTGTSDAVIAYNFSAGPQVVTIEPGDVAFETKNCQPWTPA